MNMSLTFIKLDSGLILLVASNEYFSAPILKWDNLNEFALFLQSGQEFLAASRFPLLPAVLKAFEEM